LTPAQIAAAGGVTNVIFSTPISTLTTGAVVTVTPSQSRRVYQVEASVPITLTNDLTALGANCTTNYEWETWINYTATNALSTVWDSRIQWQQQTPDLTVTGVYTFAMSTACGSELQARQTLPTVYPWIRTCVSEVGLVSGVDARLSHGNSPVTFPATNNHAILAPCDNDIIVKTDAYGGNSETNRAFIGLGFGKWHILPASGADILDFSPRYQNTASIRNYFFAYVPKTTSIINVIYIMGRMEVSSSGFNIPSVFYKIANELETAAYNAGWRP
jgi:hypothetical protein